jgi:PAS domain S-box-containing protein
LKAAGTPYEVHRYLPTPTPAAMGWRATLCAAGVITIVYFLAARLGLALLSQPSGVAVFWPASGIAAGILILSGRRAYPALVLGVVVGTVAANIMSDRSLWTSLFKGIFNAGEAILAARLLERWFGRPFMFADPHRVVGFLAAVGIAAATSAIGGAATMTLFHTNAPFWDGWRTWFLSDGIGIVVVTPLMIGLGQLWREQPSRGELLEGVLVIAILALTSFHAVSHPAESWVSFCLGGIVLPLLLWVTARCPPTFAIAGAFVVSITVICAITFDIGRFGDASVPIAERVQGAQVAVTMVTTYTLVLAALFAERRGSEVKFKQSGERLQLALDGAEAGAFSLDLASGALECDARTSWMHGHIAAPLTIKQGRRFVHPDDLAQLDAAFAKVERTGGAWTAEYRVMYPPDHPLGGETHWIGFDGTVLCNTQGLSVRMLGIARDITQRKRAEQTLAERNVQSALAAKFALVGSYAYDTDTGRMQISPSYAAIHGYPEETSEITLSAWLAGVHPEDVEKMQVLRRKAFEERRPEYNVDYRIVRSNGEVRWLESRSFISYGGDGQAQRVIGVNIDVTERKRAEGIQRALNAELDHRVKNALATVLAIITRTRDASSSHPSFVAGLTHRISSMARTHQLLSESNWRDVSLAEIVRRELAPFAVGNSEADGPTVTLRSEAAQAVASVLHELATNAAKYGAFSRHSGRVSLRWWWRQNGSHDHLAIEWKEIGGPPVLAPSRIGYGTGIIRELIPYELGGTVELVFLAAGIRCHLEIPAHWFSKGGAPTAEPAVLDAARTI